MRAQVIQQKERIDLLNHHEALPIAAFLPDICKLVRDESLCGRLIAIAAEPGAGKTTGIPPAIMAVISSQVIVTEPRRLAAKMSALRVAQQVDKALIGYRVRHEHNCTASTRLVYMTEGLLLRRLVNGDQLAETNCVILDEFHERSLATDLNFMLLRALQQTSRKDLRLIVMSATLDLQQILKQFPDAITMSVPGRSYPLSVSYEHPKLDGDADLNEICSAIEKMTGDVRCSGHILCFLPGYREIMRVQQALHARRLLSEEWRVLPLFADLDQATQDDVFRVNSARKIILSTNVAETSLTIPGVTGVVDVGNAKVAGYSPWTGLSTLDIKPISQSSAVQRAGRAGRERPGVVYRLYREQDFMARDSHTKPEILRTDLASLWLDVLAFCKRQHIAPNQLYWLEELPKEHLESSQKILQQLNATQAVETISDDGLKMAALPLPPRLSRIVVSAEAHGETQLGILLAAVLNDGPIVATQDFGKGQNVHCDIRYQCQLFVDIACKRVLINDMRSIDKSAFFNVKKLIEQLCRERSVSNDFTNTDLECENNDRLITKLLITSFPDRIAKRLGKESSSDYKFCQGGGGRLLSSSLAHGAEYIIAIEARERLRNTQGSQALTIELASGISISDLETFGKDYIVVAIERREQGGQIETWELKSYQQLSLDQRKVDVSALAGEEIFEQLRRNFPAPFISSEDLDLYHRRRQLLTECNIDHDLPEFSGDMFELLLAAIADENTRYDQINKQSLGSYIEKQLSWDALQALNRFAPKEIKLSNGKTFKINYGENGVIKIVGFIQDFFGTTKDLMIAEGRRELTVELLGPNKRPVQTTRALVQFWESGYQEIAKELGRRYPRHFWPEDPKTAIPQLHKQRTPRRV